jgi:site-specific recombinase XerD
MSDPRQLPLFSSEPHNEADLHQSTPLKQTIRFFAEHLRKEGKSEHTIKAFIADMRLLMEHTGDDVAVGSFQTRHLESYLQWMEKERGVSCSRKTYARRVTTLKVYFKWLKAIDVLTYDPAKAVIQRSGEAPLSYALNPDEIRAMLAQAATMTRRNKPDTRPEVLFRLLLDTGIKKAETRRLTIADIHREDESAPYLHVHHTARNVYKERKIPLDPDWLLVLDAYMEQYEIKDQVFTCTARNLEYILADISDGAGIPVKVSFEIMRWTSAVRDARAGVDEDSIREKLGLSRISWAETSRKIERLVELQEKGATR